MQALLDGELIEDDAFAVHAHLDRCSRCEASVDELRGALAGFSAAVALMDQSMSAGRLVGAPPPSSTVSSRRPGRTMALPRAAVLLLGLAAAAAAAVPGSPLREWVAGGARSEDPVAVTDTREAVSTVVASSLAEPEMGIGLAPLNGRFRVVVTGAEAGLRVRALLTSGPSGGAYTVGEASGTRFGGRGGVVEVREAAGDELRIEFPLSATDASLEIDGRTYVVKDGDQLRLIGDGADTVAPEVVFELVP